MSKYPVYPENRGLPDACRWRRAFSTVEMLVAITVIGSITAVAIPPLASRIHKAESTACAAQRATMDRALMIYAAEHPGTGATNLNQLVDSGYLEGVPRCPGGGEYLVMPADDPDSSPQSGCSAHHWVEEGSSSVGGSATNGIAPPPGALVYMDKEGGGEGGTGSGNHETLLGGAQWINDEERGRVLALDGLDDTIRLDPTEGLKGPFQSFSLSAWIRSTEDFSDRKPPGAQKLISKNSNFILALGPSGDRFKPGSALYLDGRYKSVSGHYTIGTGYRDIIIADNQWHHLAMTYGNGIMTLYRDGQAILSRKNLKGDVGEAGSRNLSNPIYLGSENGRSSFFKGRMDEVAVFDRALSVDEVRRMAGGTQ